MSQPSSGNLIFKAVKAFIIALFGLVIILVAWALKFTGLLCTKVGETLEKMKIKNMS